jgi:hypothetical protein
VFIDGLERGRTPLFAGDLAPGTHTILITKDYYENWERRLSFPASGRLNLLIDLTPARGQLRLKLLDGGTEKPLPADGALSLEIFVDNTLYPYSADSAGLVLLLPEGQRTVFVRLFGYEETRKSVHIEKGRSLDLQFTLQPATLRLETLKANRSVFNPRNEGNLGVLTLNFAVSAPGFATLSVYAEDGALIFTDDVYDEGDGGRDPAAAFTRRNQKAVWAGKTGEGGGAGDKTPDGIYRLKLELRPPDDTAAAPDDDADSKSRWGELMVRVDSRAEIFPLSIQRAKSGLAHAEFTRTLPEGSFQFEGALLAGQFSAGETAFSSLPFSFAARFAPLSSLEIAGAVNITPQFADSHQKALIGAALSAKKELRRSASGTAAAIPGIALGVSYGWINGASDTEAGLSAGVSLNSAFSWELPAGFALLFSPALLWTGKDGYPAEPAPRLDLAGGILFHHAWVVAGLSLRALCAFTTPPPLSISAEVHLYPPPSNFVFGALANCKIVETDARFSFGITAGFIF